VGIIGQVLFVYTQRFLHDYRAPIQVTQRPVDGTNVYQGGSDEQVVLLLLVSVSVRIMMSRSISFSCVCSTHTSVHGQGFLVGLHGPRVFSAFKVSVSNRVERRSHLEVFGRQHLTPAAQRIGTFFHFLVRGRRMTLLLLGGSVNHGQRGRYVLGFSSGSGSGSSSSGAAISAVYTSDATNATGRRRNAFIGRRHRGWWRRIIFLVFHVDDFCWGRGARSMTIIVVVIMLFVTHVRFGRYQIFWYLANIIMYMATGIAMTMNTMTHVVRTS